MINYHSQLRYEEWEFVRVIIINNVSDIGW